MAVSLRKAEDVICYGPEQDCVQLSSAPGIGKSSIVRRAAKRMGAKYLGVYAATMEAIDARGLPIPAKHDAGHHFVEWAAPSFLPLEAECAKETGTVLVNFDDWPQAPPAVRRATVRSIYGDGGERRIGDFPIYRNTRFVATGNREEDRAGVSRSETYVNDRITYIEVEPDVDEWVSGALVGFPEPEPIPNYAEIRAKINAEVAKGVPDSLVAFVKAFSMVYEFSTESRSFLSPRSIERLGRFIRAFDVIGINGDTLFEVASGTIGTAQASKYMAFHKLRDEIPNVQDILNGKEVKMPVKSEVLYVLCTALLRAAKKEHTQNVARFIVNLSQLESRDGMKVGVEVSVYMFKQCLHGEAGKELRGITSCKAEFSEWFAKNGKYFV